MSGPPSLPGLRPTVCLGTFVSSHLSDVAPARNTAQLSLLQATYPRSFLFDRFHFFKYSVHFDHSRARCDECHMFRQPGSYACQDDSDDTTVDMTDETMLYQAPFFLNILDCPLM